MEMEVVVDRYCYITDTGSAADTSFSFHVVYSDVNCFDVMIEATLPMSTNMLKKLQEFVFGTLQRYLEQQKVFLKMYI